MYLSCINSSTVYLYMLLPYLLYVGKYLRFSKFSKILLYVTKYKALVDVTVSINFPITLFSGLPSCNVFKSEAFSN